MVVIKKIPREHLFSELESTYEDACTKYRDLGTRAHLTVVVDSQLDTPGFREHLNDSLMSDLVGRPFKIRWASMGTPEGLSGIHGMPIVFVVGANVSYEALVFMKGSMSSLLSCILETV